MKDWLQVHNQGESAEIIIDGFIGDSWWDENTNTSKRFREALSSFDASKRVTVGINSEGGSIQEGLGIYNAIKQRGNVTTRIDGYALSIASIIALAGDEVISPSASVWMIHEPWSGTVGDAEDHRKSADMLDKHAETIVAVYAEKTGKSKDVLRSMMQNETWMTGEEAIEQGFADKSSPVAATLKKLENKYVHPPFALLNIFADGKKAFALNTLSRFGMAAGSGGGLQPPPSGTHKKEEKRMDTPATPITPKAEAVTPAPDNRLAELQAKLATAEASAKAERDARIKDKVERICAAKGLPDVEAWVKGCIESEVTMKILESTPANATAPVNTGKRDVTGGGTWRDQVKAHKDAKSRLAFVISNWNELRDAEKSMPVMANTGTDDTSLIGSVLADQAVLILQHRLAPLRAFTRDFANEPMAPNRPVVIQKITAGGTAQSGATSFEDTTNFVGTMVPITVTPAQLTAGGYMNQTELNRGMRVASWAEKKASEIAEKALNAVTTLITTANFTATPYVAAAAAFGADDMKNLFGLIKKAPRKFAILDGEYFARLLPSTREDWNVVESGWPAWDGVFLNTYWTGATANTVGFACDPQALAVVAGFPFLPESAGRSSLRTSTFTVPGLELTVALNSWFSTSSRTDWFTYDVCFGAALLDATAGLLIKSS